MRIHLIKKISFLLLIAGLTCQSPEFLHAQASTPSTPEKNTANSGAVYIRSESLISDKENNFFEFKVNVHAEFNDTDIKADNLKIFYEPSKGNTSSPGTTGIQADQITRLRAHGNVTIHFEDKTAVTDTADYDARNRILRLKGPDTRVDSGQDYITGEEIILYRDEERIKALNKVEVMFHNRPKDETGKVSSP